MEWCVRRQLRLQAHSDEVVVNAMDARCIASGLELHLAQLLSDMRLAAAWYTPQQDDNLQAPQQNACCDQFETM